MKILTLILPSLCLAACAGRPFQTTQITPRDVPGTALSPDATPGVRYAENIKAYPVGRYIDPNNPWIMHDGHTIYRVETTAKWNLHPQASPASSILRGPVRIRDTAASASPVGDELVAELNRQKQATQAVLAGAQSIGNKLTVLSGEVQQTRQLAKQNVQLRQEMDATTKRLDALEEQLRKSPKEQPASKNTSQPDDGW